MILTPGLIVIARNQGLGITPRDVEIEVVWVDERDVHYRRVGEILVHQTTIKRFTEIISLTTP